MSVQGGQSGRCQATGKVRYRSLGRANRNISRAIATMRGTTIPFRAYRCQFCDGWHITHQPKRGAA